MEISLFQRKIVTFLQEIEIRLEEPMSNHTSFRIGGPVEAMAFPKNPEELSLVLKAADILHVTPKILGAGTNVLAPDEGIRGLVICLKDCMSWRCWALPWPLPVCTCRPVCLTLPWC